MGCLALALGSGRNGFETRYVTLMLPVWLAIYFIWSLYAPSRWNVAVRALLLAVSVLTLWPNMEQSSHRGSYQESAKKGLP